MNLIIFGAGASHGSDDNNPTPPLGDSNLFDELEKFDSVHWSRLDEDWKRKFREDFEPAMQEFIQQGNFAAPLQWSMAEYFFTQFRAREDNVYVKILELLKPNLTDFTLVTLNYDLLIPQAATIAGMSILINSFPNSDSEQIRLILPHGSSSICCVGPRGQGISFTGGVSTGGRPRLFGGFDDFSNEKSSNVFPPVMSYFEPNKFTVSCKNFVEDERKVFEETVGNANKIAIIGMKIHRSDKHIWGPLAKSKANILYLSGKDAAKEFKLWAGENNRNNDIITEKYMQDSPAELKVFFDL